MVVIYCKMRSACIKFQNEKNTENVKNNYTKYG